MKDFDIVKYLKENKQGAYGMFNGYVDLKPLKEEEENTPAEETAEEETETVPYEAEEDQLTGLGDTDTFEQDDIVSENYEEEEYPDYTRIMDLGGERIEQGIMSLLDDGFSEEDILELCKQFIEGHAQNGALGGYADTPSLNEDISKGAAYVYAYANIRPKYDREGLERFGAKAIDEAEKLAPKYIAFAKKVQELLKDKAAKQLGKIAADKAAYGGVSMLGTPVEGLVYAKIVDLKTLDPKLASFVKSAQKLFNDPMLMDFAKIASANAEYGGKSIEESPVNGVKYISRMRI